MTDTYSAGALRSALRCAAQEERAAVEDAPIHLGAKLLGAIIDFGCV